MIMILVKLVSTIFSFLAINCEQKLLEEQNVDDFKGLLCNPIHLYLLLPPFLNIVDSESTVEGHVLHLLTEQLKHTENLLFKMQDAYSTVQLIKI